MGPSSSTQLCHNRRGRGPEGHQPSEAQTQLPTAPMKGGVRLASWGANRRLSDQVRSLRIRLGQPTVHSGGM